MHIISMLFLPVLLRLFICSASAEESVPTFEYRDEITGEVLTCDKCPPGMHMSAYCTATTPTQCAPCRRDHYTELWNYLPRCLYCDNFCTDNQEVEQECSAVRNRLCRCKEGFYLANSYCFRHSVCEPGNGVKTKGTSQMNTVCEKCPAGYFSNTSSALDACVKHQECASGQITLLEGSVNQDKVCGTCQDLDNGGETFRTFFSGFFSIHRIRMAKMKKFVLRHINKTAPKQRDALLNVIKTWAAQVPEQELRNLPKMLKDADLDCLSEKLEKRILDIKNTPGCNLTL